MDHRPGDIVNGYQLNENGTAWVPVQPAAFGPAPQPKAGMSTGAKVGIGVGAGLVGLVGLLAAVGIGVAGAMATAEPYTCDEAATEAIAISEEDADVNGYSILKIYEQEVVLDVQGSEPEIPAGENEALMLQCSGEALWSDGETTELEYGVTTDVDGDQWIYYEAVYPEDYGYDY